MGGRELDREESRWIEEQQAGTTCPARIRPVGPHVPLLMFAWLPDERLR